MSTGATIACFVGIVVGVLVVVRLLASMNNFIGKIFRFIWNINMTLAGTIPFMSWIARFVISDNPNAKKAAQAIAKETGDKVYTTVGNYLDERLAAQKAQEEENNRIKAELRAKGYKVVKVNDDMALMENGDYVSIHKF